MSETASAGKYEREGFSYMLSIEHAGTRSERRVGELRGVSETASATIAAARPGDIVQTPWGPMLYYGNIERGYRSGFLSHDTYGRPLFDERANLKDPSIQVALRQPER